MGKEIIDVFFTGDPLIIRCLGLSSLGNVKLISLIFWNIPWASIGIKIFENFKIISMQAAADFIMTRVGFCLFAFGFVLYTSFSSESRLKLRFPTPVESYLF